DHGLPASIRFKCPAIAHRDDGAADLFRALGLVLFVRSGHVRAKSCGFRQQFFILQDASGPDRRHAHCTWYSVLGTARARIRTTSLMSLQTLRRCPTRAFLALATALIISRAASADIFILESGGRVEGEWLNREEQ